MIGSTLAHYRITGLLGTGGMGEVYRAHDTKLDRDVALKVLPDDMSTDPTRLNRFVREAKTVAGLNHPNIVTLFSVDVADGRHFLTMELVEGKPLGEILPEGGFALDRLLDLSLQLAEAISEAHQHGITHRDLKPGNIMVTEGSNRLKVLDFGLAKLAAEPGTDSLETQDTLTTTRAGAVLGTPFYMAPEQARAEEVDHRADIFALGVLIYEMATGTRPFQGKSHAELMSALLRDTPRPVSEVRPGLPPGLESIISGCLKKDPDSRYGSAREIRSDLENLLNNSQAGISSPAAPSVPSLQHRPQSRLIPVLGATALPILLVAILVLWKPWGGGSAPATLDDRQIVAVLPFENLGQVEEAYFAEGITDEITSRLSLIQGLGVISRTSSRVYAGSQKSIRDIGRELNTDYILEGTIRWDGSDSQGRVRITPRLIRVADDTHLWSANYDRQVSEIFALQAEIAMRIAEALDITLASGETAALESRPTENIEAYQAYLQGMRQLNAPGFSREAFTLGIRLFERSVALDSTFAQAHAQLSALNSRMYHYGFERTEERLAQAKSAADRALRLEPDLAEAHLALGLYYYWGVRDYPRALAALEKGRDLSPGNSDIWRAIAYVKRRQGDFTASIEFLERDQTLSPLDPNAAVGLGETYGTLRLYAQGEKAFQRGIALAPDDPYPYTELALLYLRWQGSVEAARQVLDTIPSAEGSEFCRVGYLVDIMSRDYTAALQRLDTCPTLALEAGAFYQPLDLLRGWTYRLNGQHELAAPAFRSAQAHLQDKLRENPDDPRLHGALGLTLSNLGREEEAIEHARRAVALYPVSKDPLEGPVQIIHLALTLTQAGHFDLAIEELDRALSIPSILSVAWLEKDPRWDALRDFPGFTALLDRHRNS